MEIIKKVNCKKHGESPATEFFLNEKLKKRVCFICWFEKNTEGLEHHEEILNSIDLTNQNNMKELLKKIIEKWACMHEWNAWHTVNVETDYGDRYSVFHFMCKKCGKFKKIKSS